MACEQGTCKHCSALYLVKSFPSEGFSSETLNATVTFVKCSERYFCVTARHVVEVLESKNITSDSDEYSLMTTKGDLFFIFLLVNHHENGVEIKSKFKPHTPHFSFEYKKDIAMFEIPADNAGRYFQLMGKEPILFDESYDKQCEWICATGYPTIMKSSLQTTFSDMVASSCCCVDVQVATKCIEREFTCMSNYKHSYDFNGMSGGAIFCTDDTACPLLGIIIETETGTDNKTSLLFRGQKIVPDDLLSFKISPAQLPIISSYHYKKNRKSPWIIFPLDYASEEFIDKLRK